MANGKKPAANGQKIVIKCPHDSEEFESLEQLSQHVDQVHIGPGMLAGYRRESWGKVKKKSSQ